MRTTSAGRITLEQGLSSKEWELAAHTANRIAFAVYEESGLRTAFHPHCASYVETSQEVDFLLSVTHPKILGLCLDTAHYAYGGGDPLQLVRRYGDRIWHVHFKGNNAEAAAEVRYKNLDYFDAVRQGVFCDLEQSSVDFSALLAELKAAEFSGWVVVEQDVLPGTGTPLESAERNLAYLRKIGVE